MAANRICIFGANFELANRGIRALAAGTINCIEQSLPNAEIALLDYETKSDYVEYTGITRQWVIPVTHLRFSKRILDPDNIFHLLVFGLLSRYLPSAKIRRWIKKRHPALRVLDSTSMVASVAGGDSFSDIYGLEVFLYVSLPQVLSIICGTQLVLLPQTIGPFSGRFSDLLARFIMSHATLIFARDQKSLEVAQKMLGESGAPRVNYCPDVAFALQSRKPENSRGLRQNGRLLELEFLKSQNGLVGLNVNGALYAGGFNSVHLNRGWTNYRDLLLQISQELIEEKGAPLLIVPHVFGKADALDNDLKACGEVYTELQSRYRDRVFSIEAEYDQSEIKYLIGQCQFFIGSRMHACIAALSQGIPAVCIAYSRKFSGVMKTVGMQDLVVDPRIQSTEQILSIVKSAYSGRARLGAELSLSVEKSKDDLKKLFQDLG